MNLLRRITQKQIQIAILVLLVVVICLLLALLLPRTIKDPVVPEDGTMTEAMFIVLDDSGSETCIGDGLLSEELEVAYNPEIASATILTAPDYSNFLPTDKTVRWNTVEKQEDGWVVYGSIVKKLDRLELRDIVQNDEYASTVANFKKTIKPKKTLYFSTSGNDSNTGLSPDKPKKDPEAALANGNCTVLLKSGDVFPRKWTDILGANVVISTYGGTERAGFNYTQTTKEPCKLYDAARNIYSVKTPYRGIGYIEIDGKIYWHRLLKNEIKNDGDYYYDQGTKTCYIKSSKDLTGKYIQCAYDGNGIHTGNNNIVIENLEITGAGVHGISLMANQNVVIQNCYIHEIGGSIDQSINAKFGNGIQLWANGAKNIFVYKNVVTDCFDAGITPQIDSSQTANSTNLLFANNLVERCTYGFECFNSSGKYALDKVVVANNIFYDMRDVTTGYRLTKSKTDYLGFLCLWSYGSTKNNITIKNNIGFKSENYAISFSYYEKTIQPINFIGNTLICTNNDPVKYTRMYTGDNDEYVVVDQKDSEYYAYDSIVKGLKEVYNQNMVIK